VNTWEEQDKEAIIAARHESVGLSKRPIFSHEIPAARALPSSPRGQGSGPRRLPPGAAIMIAPISVQKRARSQLTPKRYGAPRRLAYRTKARSPFASCSPP
jgi:hypothetical protein